MSVSVSISGYINTLDALFNLKNSEYKHIVAVDLCINNINIFPDIITKFINLQYLNLAHNNISFLPENIGDLKKLRNIDLSNNKLISIPKSFKKLKKLCTVNLSHNFITFIPNCVKNIPLINSNSYDLDNLSQELTFLKMNNVSKPLTNLPVGLSVLRLYFPRITINDIKIPFNCKVFFDDELVN